MKKRMQLLGIAVMLIVFNACGFNENREESAAQAEYGVSEEDAERTVHEDMGDGAASEEFGNAGSDGALSGYEYEKDIIRYGDVTGALSFRKDVERIQTDYAVYYFEPAIDEQERQACITATDGMLGCIDSTLPPIEIAVFLPEIVEGSFISDNRLYTSIQSWNSTEYLAEVLLTAYGEWGNYGMAYGYANHLCKEASISGGDAEWSYRDADSFLPMSSPGLYDMNLLCFDEKFVSLQEVEAAKNNACLFVNEYLSVHSETDFLKLLSDSGTAEGVGRANEALEAFYAEYGVECSLTEIRYQYGGVTPDYAAACEYAVFYIDQNWEEAYWKANADISENFLHEDYTEVKAFFECNARQMGQYQEFFDFDSYNNELVVIFTNDFGMPSTFNGIYDPESHMIYIKAIMSLMHEYIHSLMFGYFEWESLWKREGSARYFSYKYNDYFYDFYDGMGEYYGDDDHAQEVSASLSSFLGREPDIRTDYQVMADMSGYVYGNTDPNQSYDAASSFIGYLADHYGEQAVIGYICADDEYNAEWGKSFEELVQDWNAYIHENYSGYRTE